MVQDGSHQNDALAVVGVRARRGIVRLRQPQTGSQEPVDSHAGVHGLHVPEAADEKRGCGQQDEGDGDLENDQRIADPRANASFDAAAGRFQPFDDVRAGRLQCRRQADE